MLNTENNTQEISIENAISPIVQNGLSLKEQRLLLHRMFTLAVTNAPDNESENFTANQLTPFYLSLCETLENLGSITETSIANTFSVMNNIIH
jgi:hypothetical protein